MWPRSLGIPDRALFALLGCGEAAQCRRAGLRRGEIHGAATQCWATTHLLTYCQEDHLQGVLGRGAVTLSTVGCQEQTGWMGSDPLVEEVFLLKAFGRAL